MELEIIRSKRRKKTAQAKVIDGKVRIYLPAGMNPEDEKKWIDNLLERIEKHERREKLNSDGALFKEAEAINRRYFDGMLEFEIKYVTNQNSRFGSCTPADKTIRISDRLADMPGWVRDYVLIHELSHLLEPNHSKKFWKLVNRYTYAERARGYLIAVGMEKDEDT
jgi:hypothetical protein